MNQGHPTQEDTGNDPAASITRLVHQAQSGERLAFHRLADHFHAEVFRLVYYRTRSHMDAEDLTQDIFFRAFRNVKRLRNPEVFRSWLLRIAVNRIRDFYRRQSVVSMFGILPIDDPNFQEPEEMAQSSTTEDQINRRVFWDSIAKMLAMLSKMEKEIFLLRFFDDLSIKEISEVLEKNENTVKTHLYRALKKVREAASQMDVMLELKEVI